jgi:hypothetical protein
MRRLLELEARARGVSVARLREVARERGNAQSSGRARRNG